MPVEEAPEPAVADDEALCAEPRAEVFQREVRLSREQRQDAPTLGLDDVRAPVAAHRPGAVTGGDNGIIIPARPELLGASIDEPLVFFYFTLGVFLLCLGLLHLVTISPFGKTLVGIRERETRMQMLGYNVWLHKYLAYLIAGTVAGVSGVMWTLFNLFVSPPDVELIVSAEALFMVALGGPATLIGAVIGAAIIRTLQQFVSIYVANWPLILGSIYILTIMVSRLYGVEGILGLMGKLHVIYTTRRKRSNRSGDTGAPSRQ